MTEKVYIKPSRHRNFCETSSLEPVEGVRSCPRPIVNGQWSTASGEIAAQGSDVVDEGSGGDNPAGGIGSVGASELAGFDPAAPLIQAVYDCFDAAR